jgi:hypothetical protein
MDSTLVAELIDRDWASFVEQTRRLGLGEPSRRADRIDLLVTPHGASEEFRAVLFCDDYDAFAPLLDFADVETGEQLGRAYWPRMSEAPYNEVMAKGRNLPILCTPGTRGYHLHASHSSETYERRIWLLPRQADLIARLLNRMGTYQGRGL